MAVQVLYGALLLACLVSVSGQKTIDCSKAGGCSSQQEPCLAKSGNKCERIDKRTRKCSKTSQGMCPRNSQKDCAGVAGGNAKQDCNDVCGGKATQAGGKCCERQRNGKCDTSKVKDCAGVAGGKAQVDCAKVCNGKAVIDKCGKCTSSSPCVRDCKGQWGGAAEKDCRGQCLGKATLVDGKCCERDCNNDCNGKARLDPRTKKCLVPASLCKSSPRQTCRQMCPSALPLCEKGMCAFRFNSCCMQCANASASYDCAGKIGGKAEADCFGVCNGKAVKDCAGRCGGKLKKDCNQKCGGRAITDKTGKCLDLSKDVKTLYKYATGIQRSSAEKTKLSKAKGADRKDRRTGKNKKTYSMKKLDKTDRQKMMKSMKLKADEEMDMDCSNETDTDGCELCADGCAFEDGSVINMDGGTVRFKGNSSNAMRVNVRKGARLRLQGTSTRMLSGEINGKLDMEGGTTFLSNMTGDAALNISANASLFFDGAGDSDVDVDVGVGGQMTLTGRTRFKRRVKNRGRMKVRAACGLRNP
jgi:hypothetical protein